MARLGLPRLSHRLSGSIAIEGESSEKGDHPPRYASAFRRFRGSAEDIGDALRFSVRITLTALAFFGGIKGHFTGAPVVRSAAQTVLIGGLAAAAAFGIARWIG